MIRDPAARSCLSSSRRDRLSHHLPALPGDHLHSVISCMYTGTTDSSCLHADDNAGLSAVRRSLRNHTMAGLLFDFIDRVFGRHSLTSLKDGDQGGSVDKAVMCLLASTLPLTWRSVNTHCRRWVPRVRCVGAPVKPSYTLTPLPSPSVAVSPSTGSPGRRRIRRRECRLSG